MTHLTLFGLKGLVRAVLGRERFYAEHKAQLRLHNRMPAAVRAGRVKLKVLGDQFQSHGCVVT